VTTYRTPGVYFEWRDQPAPPGLRRTDIAGFVGIALRGPLHCPVRVTSWTQFVSAFGGRTSQGYLAYAVHGFFANGGRTCWVVRVADPLFAQVASVDLTERDRPGRTLVRLTAISPGTWGDAVTVRVIPSVTNRYTVIISGLEREQEVWRDLALSEKGPGAFTTTLNDPVTGSKLVHAEYPGDVLAVLTRDPRHPPQIDPQQGYLAPNGSPKRRRFYRLWGGRDALETLTPAHFTGGPNGERWGLSALEPVDEVSIVAMPDIMPVPRDPAPRYAARPPRCEVLEEELPVGVPPSAPLELPPAFTEAGIRELQRALVQHCTRLADRVAVLDPPRAATSPQEAVQWREPFDTKYAALYYPWLRVADPERPNAPPRAVPPSGHVSGTYAYEDNRAGVHKPPANVPLEDTLDVSVRFDDETHGYLNDESVNAIRPFPGRGLRIAGARTLSGDAAWRYVNVTRLMAAIAEAIDEETQWSVFEPNNHDLWRDIDRVVRSLLDGLWRAGMLDGATAEDAYFVKCDEETNTRAQTEAGRIICEVGVQPPWPAEFVIVRIGKTGSGVRIETEPPGAAPIAARKRPST
jgi:uncharacterized protein